MAGMIFQHLGPAQNQFPCYTDRRHIIKATIMHVINNNDCYLHTGVIVIMGRQCIAMALMTAPICCICIFAALAAGHELALSGAY